MESILKATQAIVEKARPDSENVLFKFRRMQEIYLSRRSELFSNSHIEMIKRHFKSVEYKFFLISIQLEQLWALSEDSRLELWDALANSLDRLKWNDNQLIIGSMFLESFLFEARSFLDVYMFYICLLTGIEKPGKMSFKKFKKYMRRCKEPFQTKAVQLQKYFEEEVFGSNKWGYLVKSLRDKITHQEHLRPSRNGSEILLGKVLLDWPTIRGMTFDRFSQHIENCMFEMLRKTSPLLFELEWKSGPYKHDF